MMKQLVTDAYFVLNAYGPEDSPDGQRPEPQVIRRLLAKIDRLCRELENIAFDQNPSVDKQALQTIARGALEKR